MNGQPTPKEKYIPTPSEQHEGLKKVIAWKFNEYVENDLFKDRLQGSKNAISKLLADKKKKLNEYYAFERDNSYFDVDAEDAKIVIEEKSELKKEIKTLELYLLDLAKVSNDFTEKIKDRNCLDLVERVNYYVSEQRIKDVGLQNMALKVEIHLLTNKVKEAKIIIDTLVSGIVNDNTAEIYGEIITSLYKKINEYERNTEKTQ